MPISAARLARTMDRLLEKDTLIVNESPTSKDILMANFKFSLGSVVFSNSSGGYLGWGWAPRSAPSSPRRSGASSPVWATAAACSAFKDLDLANTGAAGRDCLQQSRLYGGQESVPRLRRKNSPRCGNGRRIGRSGDQLRATRDTFGIYGERVEQPDAIEPAIKRALEQNGPALVDVVISQNTRKD